MRGVESKATQATRRAVQVGAALVLLAALLASAWPDGAVSAATLTRGGFTTSASISAANVAPGDTVTITARVTSSTTSTMMVYFEVRGPTANRLDQFTFDNELLVEGVEQAFPVTWTVPVDAAPGGYTVEVRIFTPGQGQNRHWNESAGFLTVGMGSPPPTGGPVRIMPLGDSFTYGVPIDGGYRIDLWTMLNTAGHSVDFVGSGHNGVTGLPDKHHEGHREWLIDELAGGATPWLLAYRPQIVLLLIGTQDMVQNHLVSGAPARLGSLIDQIRAAAPDAEIVVSSLPRNSDGDIQARIQAYNDQLPDLVLSKGDKVRFVNAYATIDPVHLAPDGTHLTAEGYGRLAAVWFPVVDAILATLSPSPTPSHTPTLTLTPTSTPTLVQPQPPVACSPRPRVLVATARDGPERLTATISAAGQNNGLLGLRIVEARNAVVEAAGQSGSGAFTVELPDAPTSVTLAMTRQRPGEAVHVSLVVIDRCGEWTTFVGGGTDAF